MISSSSILLLIFAIECASGEVCPEASLMTILDNYFDGYYSSVANSKPSTAPPIPDNQSMATPLYFGLMVAPSEDSDYLNTTLTAVQLALDTINADSDLLRGYSLHYTLTVSQV